MASSIGGISSSTASSIRGYGGLASGLDRDSLIESMTYATTSKIQVQKQKQQKLQWTQTSIRGISDKLIQFSQKYRSYTSSSNLSSSSFFNRTSITANGANAGKVTVTGNGSAASNMSITEIKQMAVNASMAMNKSASNQSLSTGELPSDLNTEKIVSTLENQSLTFGYGNKTYGISLTSGTTSDGYTYRYGTAAEAVESINKQLAGVSISSSANTKKSLGDVVEAYVGDGDTVQFRTHGDTAGNTVTLKGGSAQAWKALGLGGTDQAVTLTENGSSLTNQNLTEKKSVASLLGGKSLSFTYNGTTKSITLPSEEKLKEAGGLNALKEDIQKQLNKEFGTGRIQVSLSDKNELQFKTIRPDKTEQDPNDPNKKVPAADESSILSLSGGSSGVLGLTGALGVDYGTSNRLNTGTSLENSGLAIPDMKVEVDGVTLTGMKAFAYNNAGLSDDDKKKLLKGELDLSDIKLNLKINGEEIKDNSGDTPKDLTYASSISKIISAINSSDAGVKVSYLSSADKFTMEATSSGASGSIKLEGAGAELLFGKPDVVDADGKVTASGDYTITEGKDALIMVKYAGSDDPVELVRGSNSFSLDGMNVTLNGTFKADEKNPSDAITFTAKVDVDKITNTVSEMITAYNEALELINKEVGTKPARGYEPLTDQQRDELSESQIEKWEEKAKEGLLFNDTDIRGLADKMRFIFPSGSEDKRLLESMGITTSDSYADNGKLVFDETKFRAALESDPESVQQLFSRPAGTNNADDKGGFMARVGNIFEMYASTTGSTKGILVERAGSTYAPTSILNNSIQKQLNSIDDELKKLNKRLKTETDRYVSKFTYLETMISQMNSQSSYLSQLGGGA